MKTLTDFEKIAQKSKRRSRIKTITISTVVALASLGLIVKGLTEITSHNGNKIKDHYLLMSEIAYPNIDYSSWGFNATSQFTGIFCSHRFKTIDGIEVPFETYESHYSLIPGVSGADLDGTTSGDKGNSLYTRNSGYKVPKFYNVNHAYESGDYSKVTQDISLLPQMGGQVVEVAVTFDKAYTLKEIAELIPDNLQINWYWIGSQSKYDTSELPLSDQFGMRHTTQQNMSYSESKKWEEAANEVVKKDKNADLSKIKTNDPDKVDDYTSLLNTYTFFKAHLKEAIHKGYLGSNYSYDSGKGQSQKLNTKVDVQAYLKANSSAKNAKFSGVILTGRSENFAQLEKANWIFASNIGQSVVIQPYHQLEK